MNRRSFIRAGAIVGASGLFRGKSKAATPEDDKVNVDVPDLIFIHSPLVGGSFWTPVARELGRRGRRCHVPTTEHGEDGSLPAWREWPDLLHAALPITPGAVLVGHSAAGMLLPALAKKIDARALIFVDANIPHDSGSARPVDPEFMKFVQSLPVVDGRLPRWSEWWPKNAMETLIPDAQERRRFDSDLPRLTLEWFDDSVGVPTWKALDAGYVQTSQRFSQEAEKACMRGWPVRVLNGTHLHPLLEPIETSDAIIEIASQFEKRLK